MQIQNVTLEHKADITDIGEDITDIGEDITVIGEDISNIKIQIPPIGSIIAWLPSLALSSQLPSGWQRCDGQPINAGPLAGSKTPDLNESRRFLRGGADSNAGSVEGDTVRDHLHADPGHTHQVFIQLFTC